MPFDIRQWKHVLPDVTPDQWGNVVTPYIIGPGDAATILELRNRIKSLVTLGRCISSDLFLLATGEPQDRFQTKIGGVPCLRRSCTWPCSQFGTPLPFLAQFDLTESRDVLPDLLWDVILIFADPKKPREGVVLGETKCDPSTLISSSDVPAESGVCLYSCERWRATVFPEWRAPTQGDAVSYLELPDGSSLLEANFVLQPLSMQIGPCPFVPPGTQIVGDGEIILCSLPSIAPLPYRPYPFLNRDQPLTTTEAESTRIIIAEWDDDDAFGVLFVIASQDGALDLRFANL